MSNRLIRHEVVQEAVDIYTLQIESIAGLNVCSCTDIIIGEQAIVVLTLSIYHIYPRVPHCRQEKRPIESVGKCSQALSFRSLSRPRSLKVGSDVGHAVLLD
jgi:hypothetical protein